MATQVSYKGSTITSFTNTSKTLKTSGKYMEDDVIVSESISLQSKTVAPTTTTLTVTADSGYEGLSSVTVESAGGGATFIWDEEDSHGGTIRYISTGNSVSGTSNITANGTYTVASYYSANVNVIPSLQSKSVNPSESVQTVSPDSNYVGLSSVSVGAISSTYVGSGIAVRTSTDLSASGATVSVPGGYYASDVSKAVSNGSATTPATSITANPSVSINTSTGVVTATTSKSQNITPTVSAGYVSSGTAGTVTVSGSSTLQLTVQSGTTVSPTESEKTAVAAGKYTTGAVKVGAISSNYVGSNITTDPTPTVSGDTVTIPKGYYSAQTTKSVASGSVTAPTNIIGTGATIGYNKTNNTIELTKSISVTPNVTTAGYISQGTAGTASVDLIATCSINDSNSLTASGATVTVPRGYYPSEVSKSVASGTAGTPVATKGTVSNHSVSITPSVTNVTGFITGSTKTGTAVSVSASELVSGAKSISSNGTNIDVTNYATVNVSVDAPTPVLQSKSTSYTPTESVQTGSITADNGYDGLSQVDVTINAVASDYIGSGITLRDSSNLSASGATVTVPAGYYSAQASKSVTTMTLPTSTSITASGTAKLTIDRSTSKRYLNIPAGYNSAAGYYTISAVADGTAGTPTATKGTVSNHSVNVTPSVTNTTGYITGSTKTGTAVTVSASELVSGTYSVTSSGTKDVTNYASASVPAGTEGTPTATKGTVSNHSVSVTPSVTNTSGFISGGTKTGTAVTVSASELVSGTYAISSFGTYDVINYATVSIDSIDGGLFSDW